MPKHGTKSSQKAEMTKEQLALAYGFFTVEAKNANTTMVNYKQVPTEQFMSDLLSVIRGETSELLKQRDELLEALKVCYTSLKTYGAHPLVDKQVEAIITKAEER